MIRGQSEAASDFLYQPYMSTASGLVIDTTLNHLTPSISISGSGEMNQLFGLWHNGKFTASAIPTAKNRFEFNVQTMYSGENTFIIWAVSENGQTTMIDSFSISYKSPRIELLAKPFEKLSTDQKILALTFDAGSSAQGADSIIDILAARDIKTTVFLTGTFLKRFPHIVKKIRLHGNELANHTFSHPHLTSYAKNGIHHSLENIDRSTIHSQLRRTDSLYFDMFNEHLKPYWRAPFGEYNRTILNWAAEAGYKHIGWSEGCDTRDWVTDRDSELYRSAEQIYTHLIDLESRGLLKGAIILFHLHTERENDQPYSILRKLIDTLLNKGYQIVPISTLLTSDLIT